MNIHAAHLYIVCINFVSKFSVYLIGWNWISRWLQQTIKILNVNQKMIPKKCCMILKLTLTTTGKKELEVAIIVTNFISPKRRKYLHQMMKMVSFWLDIIRWKFCDIILTQCLIHFCLQVKQRMYWIFQRKISHLTTVIVVLAVNFNFVWSINLFQFNIDFQCLNDDF